MPTIELADEEGVQSSGIKFLDQKIFENSFSKIGHYRYEPLVLILRTTIRAPWGDYTDRPGWDGSISMCSGLLKRIVRKDLELN
jgi:hypothetical protein